ncbi:MAG: non-homologous end-joining DNA ligase [Peptococcaceae bacterium]|nr:non-homologous end-joining DNA ligase [Peptococcaceae bacterium]
MVWQDIAPMLATAGTPFDSPDFLFEIKWDGVRAIAVIDAQNTTLFSRNGLDITPRYPELQFSGQFQHIPVVLDGEIIALRDGMPDFYTLQTRDRLQDQRKIAAAVRTTPVIFMAFDLLRMEGKDVTALPLRQRKELLQLVAKAGKNLLLSEFVVGAGMELVEFTRAKGLEGVVAKRLDSPYLRGQRSGNWVKVRNTRSMSCVVCGYLAGRGSRKELGSLILGAYTADGLAYIGCVGSGISRRDINLLHEPLRRLTRVDCPFQVVPDLKGAVWLEPRLVCEIHYLEKRKVLRHPVFVGWRGDKSPKQCGWEQA